MRRQPPFLFLILGLLLSASAARTATVAPPADLGELARLSIAVVLAEAQASTSLAPTAVASPLPYTVTRFRTVEWVGGARVGEEFEVVEPGGEIDGRVAVIGGAPHYQAGRTYLLFLDLRDDGYWRSRMLAYGLLVEEEATGLLEPLPEAGWIEPVSGDPFEPIESYRRETLLDHLRAVLTGEPWNREQAGAVPALRPVAGDALVPTGCQYITWDDPEEGDGLPVRWFDWETGGGAPARIRPTTPGQVGIGDGGVSAVQDGAQAWRAHGNSLIRNQVLATAPRQVSCTGGNDWQDGAVWFNDPCNDIPNLNNCAGTLAFGGLTFSTGTRFYDGALWHPAAPNTSFVVVNNGTQCIGGVNFKEMMTHELGHTVGFGHHAATPAPNPTMSASLKADGRGASLVGRDRSCASFAYHTFLDVPYESTLWPFVEAIENRGVTGGCAAPGRYCPGASTSRAQMAIFLLRAKHGAAYNPPACTAPGPFDDVPCSNPFAAWIEELVERGVTSGCGGGDYCPGGHVTRAQMAAFLLRTLEGSGYQPPACTTAPFNDVPAGNPFCRWIRALVNRGVTSGCGGGNYCPGEATTRGQMAIFLVRTFDLTLPN